MPSDVLHFQSEEETVLMCMTPLVRVPLKILCESPPLQRQVFGNLQILVCVSCTLKKINTPYLRISLYPNKTK